MNESTVCEKCGTKATKKTSYMFPEGTWGWGCNCASDAYDKEHEANYREMITQIKERMKSKNSVTEIIPPVHRLNLLDPDIKRISPDIFKIADNWQDFKDTNIMISGVSRTGKSFDLAWLMSTLHSKGKFSIADDFVWTTVKSMCEDICGSENRVRFDFYQECRVLVVDDIMVYGNEASMLFEVIEGRTNKFVDHPTWFTTNHTPDGLEKKLNHIALTNRLFQIDNETRKPKYKLIIK